MTKSKKRIIAILCVTLSMLTIFTLVGKSAINALAASFIDYSGDDMFWIHFYDGSGNELYVSAEGDLDAVPAFFRDGNGTEYHCVEPFSTSYSAGDLKDGYDAIEYYTPKLGRARAEELVRQLGYLWKWSAAHYSGQAKGIVRQITTWEIEFTFGLKSENYGPSSYNANHAYVESMQVDMGGYFIDSNQTYAAFMAYYNSIQHKGDGTGVVMVPQYNAPTQKVARFDVIERASLKVTKNVANPDSNQGNNDTFNFTVTFSGPSAPATQHFTLKNGQSWQLDDIKLGVVATVSEDTNDDYTTTWSNTQATMTGGHGPSNPVTVNCTNTRKTGGIKITKNLDGPSRQHQFNFRTIIKRPDGSTYKDERFALTADQSKTFNDIPTRYTYQITEEPEAHFTLLSFNNNIGTITWNNTPEAEAKNQEHGYATMEKHLTM